MYAVHHDEANYSNPGEFDPFRFARMREAVSDNLKLQIVTPGPEYLNFGLGKHAWCVTGTFWTLCSSSYFFLGGGSFSPGRFFAAIELKAMLAHIVVSYDVKLENEGKLPPNQWIAGTCLPNLNTNVMFRRRTA